jgi:UDP-N-acetylmuramyl tripeptide synthase
MSHCLFSFEVIGCCGEDERGKRPLMTKIATEKSEVTMLASDNPKGEDPCKYFDIGICLWPC